MKLDKVEICEDFSRNDIIRKFKQIQKESDEFEAAHKNDLQAVMGVYIIWIGPYIDVVNHDDLGYQLDGRIWPYIF